MVELLVVMGIVIVLLLSTGTAFADGVAVLDLMGGTVTSLEAAVQAAKGNDSLESGIKKALKAIDSFERAIAAQGFDVVETGTYPAPFSRFVVARKA